MEQETKKSESFFQKITYTDGIYPEFSIVKNEHPSRVYAVPILGMLIKFIALIPVFIVMIFLSIWLLVVQLINPFIVLFTGQYWEHAYSFTLGFLKYSANITLYFYGLTDKYPGFSLQTTEGIVLEIPKPQNPGRLYAIPLLGMIIRVILMIPYFIFSNVITQAATIGVFLLAWAVVLFKGRYPDGIFELARDSVRINISTSAYTLGLSDRYPSFYVNMDHDKIKIILIVIAILLGGWSYTNDVNKSSEKRQSIDYTVEQQVQDPQNLINTVSIEN